MTDLVQPWVYVVDDEPLVRDSLQFLLESAEVAVRTFPSAAAFLAAVPPQATGCLLLDLWMPEMDGEALHNQMLTRGYTLPVILLTGHGDVPVAVAAMKRGAFDFLQKPANPEYLLSLLARALRADSEQREFARQRRQLEARYATLTEREAEMMRLVCQGLNNREMAVQVNVSTKTIEVHRGRVMHKMQATSLAELVQQAVILKLF